MKKLRCKAEIIKRHKGTQTRQQCSHAATTRSEYCRQHVALYRRYAGAEA